MWTSFRRELFGRVQSDIAVSQPRRVQAGIGDFAAAATFRSRGFPLHRYPRNAQMLAGDKGHVIISVTDVSMAAIEPLTPAVFHTLLSLVDGEKHGYGIMQEVAARTNNTLIMGPGTLYGTLKRMLEAGLVEECGERPDPSMDDQRRRYYRLTRQGRRAARAEAERLEALVQAARAKSLLRHPRHA